MKIIIKKFIAYFLLILLGVCNIHAEQESKTYLIPVKGEINQGLVDYLHNAVKEAESNNATQIIFEIDTYGGLVDSAINISDIIRGTSVPTICYIQDNAISAGVIIAISGDKVVANQSINIGSAETRPNEEKYISFWTGKLRTVAKENNRNPDIVAGMADASIEIEGIKEKGKLLNLTADEALQHGIVDELVDGKAGLFTYLNIKPSDVVELDYDIKTNISRFVNNPYVSVFLIAIGIIGIVGEMFTAGFGILGSLGILSFALFFAGKMLAGHAHWGILILFATGLILLIIEATVPGFGIPGIVGIVCVILSIILGSSNLSQGIFSFFVALVISVVVIGILLKYAPRSQLFSHIILKDEQKSECGYVSYIDDKHHLIGQEGETITLLRPAGTVLIGERKIDVVSEGEFIEKGSKVKVIAVEGNRVVVRKI